jgi:hypothetical protein
VEALKATRAKSKFADGPAPVGRIGRHSLRYRRLMFVFQRDDSKTNRLVGGLMAII